MIGDWRQTLGQSSLRPMSRYVSPRRCRGSLDGRPHVRVPEERILGMFEPLGRRQACRRVGPTPRLRRSRRRRAPARRSFVGTRHSSTRKRHRTRPRRCCGSGAEARCGGRPPFIRSETDDPSCAMRKKYGLAGPFPPARRITMDLDDLCRAGRTGAGGARRVLTRPRILRRGAPPSDMEGVRRILKASFPGR